MKLFKILCGSPICIFCGQRTANSELIYDNGRVGVCSTCNNALHLNPAGFFRELDYEDKSAVAPFLYSGIFRKAFGDYKFKGCRAYADVFAFYLTGMCAYLDSTNDMFLSGADIVTTIPLPPERLREREYNQCEPLAKALAKQFDAEYEPCALMRTRESKRQSTLSKSERMQNLLDMFLGDKAIVDGKRVILFDDICTTGSTLKNAYQALKDAGAIDVYPISLAIEAKLQHSKEYNELLR